MPPEIWNNVTQITVVGLIGWSIFTLYQATLTLAKLETRVESHDHRIKALED